MNPCELTLSITILANSIANVLSDSDLEIAAAFSQLGDTLATIVLQRSVCQKKDSSDGFWN